MNGFIVSIPGKFLDLKKAFDSVVCELVLRKTKQKHMELMGLL